MEKNEESPQRYRYSICVCVCILRAGTRNCGNDTHGVIGAQGVEGVRPTDEEASLTAQQHLHKVAALILRIAEPESGDYADGRGGSGWREQAGCAPVRSSRRHRRRRCWYPYLSHLHGRAETERYQPSKMNPVSPNWKCMLQRLDHIHPGMTGAHQPALLISLILIAPQL